MAGLQVARKLLSGVDGTEAPEAPKAVESGTKELVSSSNGASASSHS